MHRLRNQNFELQMLNTKVPQKEMQEERYKINYFFLTKLNRNYNIFDKESGALTTISFEPATYGD